MTKKAAQYPRFDRACTIYCLKRNDVVVECLKNHLATLDLRVEKSRGAWRRITLRHADATLTLNKTRFVRPGFKGPDGAFNRVVMGTSNFFRTVRVHRVETRQSLLKAISETDMLIGCVAEPAFSAELGHYKLVFRIARAMNGLIFDGQGMLDAEGKLVLDKTGKHGLVVWSADELS
jgi:hypothetical protein